MRLMPCTRSCALFSWLFAILRMTTHVPTGVGSSGHAASISSGFFFDRTRPISLLVAITSSTRARELSSNTSKGNIILGKTTTLTSGIIGSISGMLRAFKSPATFSSAIVSSRRMLLKYLNTVDSNIMNHIDRQFFQTDLQQTLRITCCNGFDIDGIGKRNNSFEISRRDFCKEIPPIIMTGHFSAHPIYFQCPAVSIHMNIFHIDTGEFGCYHDLSSRFKDIRVGNPGVLANGKHGVRHTEYIAYGTAKLPVHS